MPSENTVAYIRLNHIQVCTILCSLYAAAVKELLLNSSAKSGVACFWGNSIFGFSVEVATEHKFLS